MTLTLAQLNSGLARAVSIVACLAAGSMSAAAQSEAEAIVRSWVESDTLVPFVEFDVRDVSSEGDLLTVTGFSVAFEFDLAGFALDDDAPDPGTLKYRLFFPSATFEDLRDTGGRFATDMFEADEMIVEFQVENGAMLPIEVGYEGISIANWSWAKIPDIVEDEDRPLTSVLPALTAIYDHDFDSAIIDGATGVSPAANGGDLSISYGTIVAGRTRSGNVSRLDADSVSMHATGPDDEHIDIEIGALTATDYNIAALFRAFGPEADQDSEYETLIGGYRIDGVDMTGLIEGIDFVISIGEVLLEDVGVRPPSFPVLERADAMIASNRAGNIPEFGDDEYLEFVTGLYGAFRLGAFEISDFRVVEDGLETQDLGSIGIYDLSADGLGEFTMRDLVFRSPEDDASGSFGEISIAGLTFPSLQSVFAFNAAVDHVELAALEALPTLERFAAMDVALDTPDGLMSLGAFLIEMSDHIGSIPTTVSVAIEDLDLLVSELDDEPREQLQALGYKRLTGSLSLSGAWDEETETVEMESEGDLEDGARFSFAATIGEIARELFEDPQAVAPTALETATLEAASVSLEDDSLRDRIIDMVAEQQGTEPEMVRQMAHGVVPFALAQLGRPEFTASVSAALKSFLEGEGKLDVDVAPDEPVPLMQLSVEAQADPGSAIDKLKITVDAE
ncbi:hypothetical protein [Oricola sp.]|uniref:hypothetical protein n=1 Tax=Oricola sp. TaxID=1979950 RepID=UPI003BAAD075